MRILKAAAFVAALSIIPVAAFAQSAATAKKAAPAAKKSAVASHTTAGTVKSSTDSALVISGRIVGRRRASIVFPAPGGPMSSAPCPPAAAIVRGRLAHS